MRSPVTGRIGFADSRDSFAKSPGPWSGQVAHAGPAISLRGRNLLRGRILQREPDRAELADSAESAIAQTPAHSTPLLSVTEPWSADSKSETFRHNTRLTCSQYREVVVRWPLLFFASRPA